MIIALSRGVQIILCEVCRGIRGQRVGGHADRAYMLLGMCKQDFVVARLFRLPSCLFYLPLRRGPALQERKTMLRRVGGMNVRGRSVVLENRILIA